MWFVTASLQRRLSPSGNVNLQITEIATSINNEQPWVYFFLKYSAGSKDEVCILAVMWSKPWGRILFL